MRYSQFKLSEDEIQSLRPVQPVAGPKITDAEVEDDLDNIENAAQNAKEEDPSLYKNIVANLKKLQQQAKQALAKKGQEPAVEEDAAVATQENFVVMMLNDLRDSLAELCNGKPIEVCQEPNAMNLAKKIAVYEKSLPEHIKQEKEISKQAGKEEEQKERHPEILTAFWGFQKRTQRSVKFLLSKETQLEGLQNKDETERIKRYFL